MIENSTIANLAVISHRILDRSLGAFVIFISAGSVAFSTALISIRAIKNAGKFKKKFYVLYTAMSVNDALMGLAYTIWAFSKVKKIFYGEDDVTNFRECCTESALLYFSQAFGLYIVAAITLDRFLSFVMPFQYKVWTGRRFSYPLVGVALFLSLGELLFMMINNSSKSFELAICGAASCWHPMPVYVTVTVFHLVVSSMIILTNAYLLVNVILSAKSSDLASSNKIAANTKLVLRRNFSTNIMMGSRCQPAGSCLTSDRAVNDGMPRKDTLSGTEWETSVILLDPDATIFISDGKESAVKLRSGKAPSTNSGIYGRIIKSLALMILVHVTSHFASRLILLINICYSMSNGQVQYAEVDVVASYARSLIVINGAVHFFLYYGVNTGFKNAVDGLFL